MNSPSSFQPSGTVVPARRLLLPAVLALMLGGSLFSMTGLAADAANRQQAIDMALQREGGDGKVLGVQTEQDRNGQTTYAVKILSNGRIRVYRFRQAP